VDRPEGEAAASRQGVAVDAQRSAAADAAGKLLKCACNQLSLGAAWQRSDAAYLAASPCIWLCLWLCLWLCIWLRHATQAPFRALSPITTFQFTSSRGTASFIWEEHLNLFS